MLMRACSPQRACDCLTINQISRLFFYVVVVTVEEGRKDWLDYTRVNIYRIFV